MSIVCLVNNILDNSLWRITHIHNIGINAPAKEPNRSNLKSLKSLNPLNDSTKLLFDSDNGFLLEQLDNTKINNMVNMKIKDDSIIIINRSSYLVTNTRRVYAIVYETKPMKNMILIMVLIPMSLLIIQPLL